MGILATHILLNGRLWRHINLLVRVRDVCVIPPRLLLRYQVRFESTLAQFFILLLLQKFLSSLLLFHVLLVKNFVTLSSSYVFASYFWRFPANLRLKGAVLKLLIDLGLFVQGGVLLHVSQTLVNRLSIVWSIVANDLGFESAAFQLLLSFNFIHDRCFLWFHSVVG
jgi:hypothetical protein